jgi:non-canonical (house-cleaning) NTP pyrophosphatase
MLRVTVGSLNPIKILATQLAFERVGIQADVRSGYVDSGQDEQPLGIRKTFDGACRRALLAQRLVFAGPSIGIGIESGIIAFTPTLHVDLACVVVANDQGSLIATTSQGLYMPVRFLNQAKVKGLSNNTVGMEVAKSEFGGRKDDPHSALTEGLIPRRDTLVQAVYAAIIQLPK